MTSVYNLIHSKGNGRPTVLSEQDASFFSEQGRPSFPNKTDRLFWSEQDRSCFSNKTHHLFRARLIDFSAFPNVFTEQDRPSYPNTERASPNKTKRLFPNNTDRLFRRRSSFRTRPTVFSEQDRTSLHNKTERLYRTWPTVFCRTRPVVFSEPRQVLVTSVVVGTKHICTMIIVTAIRNIFYKNSPLVTVLYGLGPIKYNCTHNFTYWNFKLVSCG